jgi:thioredoxin 1
MADILHLTDQDFESQVLASKTPVLVDFYADWCGPCHMLAPIIEQLNADYDGVITVAKLDVDSAPKAAAAYGVMSIPTVILFVDGKPAQRLTGYQPMAAMKSSIDGALAAARAA